MIETATKTRQNEKPPARHPWGDSNRSEAARLCEQYRPRARREAGAAGAPAPASPLPSTFPDKKVASRQEATPTTLGEELLELARQAEEGNQSCLKRLRQLLDEHPDIWRAAGDVGAIAERAWIEVLAEGNVLISESVARQVRELKKKLAGADTTPLEGLLVDVVGVTWLAAKDAEIKAASSTGGSLQQAAFRLKRAESAQRRLLGAVKTLAKIRALLPRAGVKAAAED